VRHRHLLRLAARALLTLPGRRVISTEAFRHFWTKGIRWT
jgi:hypothetical protein